MRKTEAEIRAKIEELWGKIAELRDERDTLTQKHPPDVFRLRAIAEDLIELRAKTVALNWVLGEWDDC